MTEPIILAETEEPARRLVKLAEDHDVDYSGTSSVLLTATMTKSGVKVRRMSSEKKQKEFSLHAQEMDTLVASWTAFKDDQQAKADAESNRQAQIIAEAYAIAKNHPSIKIEECGESTWVVTESETGWNCHSHYRSYGAADLLKDTKEACTALQVQTGATTSGDAA